MLSNPRIGQAVEVRYRKALRPIARLHGKRGIVTIVGRGRPRNHEVEIDGRRYVVPAGHLKKLNVRVNGK